MSRVLSIRELRLLPVGFRERFDTRKLTAEDVVGLKEIGYRLRDISHIRAARRVVRDRPARKRHVIRPTNRQQAQLLDFFRRQDIVKAFDTWPVRMQNLAVKGHKKNNERFLLTMFFLLIGVPPHLVPQWVLADYTRPVAGSNRRELVTSSYDTAAIKQVESILHKAHAEPGWLSRYQQLAGTSHET